MNKIAVLFFSFFTMLSTAQNAPLLSNGLELGRFEYSLLPSLGDTQLEKTAVSLGMGKKINKSLLAVRLNYTKYDIYFKDALFGNALNDFENIHTIRLNLIYKRPLRNNWFLNALISPMLSSTFEGDISADDFFYNTFLSTSKVWTKNDLKSNLTVGIGFGTLFGRPRLFPLVSYSRQVSLNTKYSIGLPVTGLFHNIDKKSAINFTLSPEGFFANNSASILNAQGEEIANSRMQFNGLKIALGYQLKFEENWITHFKLGYMPISNMEVIDIEDDTLYDIDTNETIFLNIAVSFNLNKKRNEKTKN
ncbi:DUF6268 family outer membrane beta-barrel protein [Winogradskyella luteola]|uniref:DUF6268 domain-containing protein n=1 Tax=Winogradskyella luteola TaxID=2828330 RepID=A0A9X1F6W4_9FLAO|nr:DUF6268 family outer membrane beta-barrel protein [Winogradskyella luteola]MBV7267748.1 hypothetical protein [Winogradskyella luteola]